MENEITTQKEEVKQIDKNVANELEDLKKDILQQVNASKHKKTLPWGSSIITLVLSILTILSVTQTVQSATIFKKAKSGDFGTSASSVTTNSTQNLPDMVGGC